MSPESSGGAEDTTLCALLDRQMPADPEAIAEVVDSISDSLARLEVPEQKRLEVALAVQEALANAVVHGCKNDRSKQVRCRLQSDVAACACFLVAGRPNPVQSGSAAAKG